jgi:hypothetical protein
MLKTLRILALLGGAASLGCTGDIGGGAGGKSTGGPDDKGMTGTGATMGGGGGKTNPPNNMPPPSNVGALDDAKTVPGPSPLRRLTRLEYDNTIRDLLGVTSAAGSKLTPDQGANESGFTMGGSITGSTDARAALTNAEEITALVLPKLGSILPCNPVPTARVAQDTCADQFVEKFGLRAFRRPLAATELADLKALYRAHLGLGDSFEAAIGAVITAVLQTPQFLYHWESTPGPVQKDGALIRLGGYELASKLSYLFWATMPDEALFTAVKDGKLNSPDDLGREARRLLADPRAKEGLQDFFVQWLELGSLSDLEKAAPEWTPALAKAIDDETRDFVSSLFFGGNGKLETLLTSTKTTVDPALAKLYGITGVTAKKETELDATKRAGILTLAGFLSAKAEPEISHPIRRGDGALRRLLCTELIIPATLEVPPLPEPKPGQTTRERYEIHSMSPCATCHKLIDPIGFAFEHYDAVGAYRDTEVNKPINAKGSYTFDSIGEVQFDGAVQLMKHLAKAKEAADCMATQWLRYTLRRREVMGETPSVKVLEASLGTGADLKELMVAATKARTFTHRAPSPGEVTQ